MREHILVAHSAPDEVAAIRRLLDSNGLRASSVATRSALFDAVRRGDPDLVVVDVGRSPADALDLVRQLQRIRDIPLILQSATDEAMDRIIGLELGADDYLIKPYNPRELVARIRAVLRRHRRTASPTMTQVPMPRHVTFGDVQLDTKCEIAHRLSDGRDLNLTHKEATLLAALLSAEGAVVHRSALLALLYGANAAVTERVIDAHIARLRKKLSRTSGGMQMIVTVHGEGYRFAGHMALNEKEAQAV